MKKGLNLARQRVIRKKWANEKVHVIKKKPILTKIKEKVMNKAVETAINAGANWINDWSQPTLDEIMNTGADRIVKYVNSTENSIDNTVLPILSSKLSAFFIILTAKSNQ